MSLSANLIEQIRDARRKGFFHLLIANALIGLLGFAAQLLVAKVLTPIEIGQIRTMQSFVSLATIIAGLGFNTAVLKLCSEDLSQGEKAYIFRRTLVYSAVPIPIVLAILFVLAKLDVFSPDRTVNSMLPVYMFLIPATVYGLLMMAYLQALKKIQQLAWLQVLVRGIGFTAVVVFSALYGLVGFVIATVAAGTLALIPFWRSVRPRSVAPTPAGNVLSRSMQIAGWSVSANAVTAIGAYMDIFLLNYLSTDRAELGYYGIATMFIMGLSQSTATVQTIATPYFSEKQTNQSEFMRVLRQYQRLLTALSAGIAAAAALIVPHLITALYGPDYAVAGTFFRILTLKYFLWSCYVLPAQAVLGLGLVRYNFLAASLQVFVSAMCGFYLISTIGTIGAAWAQVVSNAATLVLMLALCTHAVRRHFGRAG
jgi:O-antigen/teichoic acid export membrane protein